MQFLVQEVWRVGLGILPFKQGPRCLWCCWPWDRFSSRRSQPVCLREPRRGLAMAPVRVRGASRIWPSCTVVCVVSYDGHIWRTLKVLGSKKQGQVHYSGFTLKNGGFAGIKSHMCLHGFCCSDSGIQMLRFIPKKGPRIAEKDFFLLFLILKIRFQG